MIKVDNKLDSSEEVSPEEVSRLIRCSCPHVYKLIGQGVLHASLVGTHKRLNKQKVLQYIERDKVSRREALLNLAKFDQGEEI
jgi:excisionase family DNA binding protein